MSLTKKASAALITLFMAASAAKADLITYTLEGNSNPVAMGDFSNPDLDPLIGLTLGLKITTTQDQLDEYVDNGGISYVDNDFASMFHVEARNGNNILGTATGTAGDNSITTHNNSLDFTRFSSSLAVPTGVFDISNFGYFEVIGVDFDGTLLNTTDPFEGLYGFTNDPSDPINPNGQYSQILIGAYSDNDDFWGSTALDSSSIFVTQDIGSAAVPEPSGFLMIAIGTLAFVGCARIRPPQNVVSSAKAETSNGPVPDDLS